MDYSECKASAWPNRAKRHPGIKEAVSSVKRQLANYVSTKWLMSKAHKEMKKLNTKEII